MTFRLKSLKHILVLTIISLGLLTSASTQAQIPDIVVDVGDTTAYPGSLNTPISIYLSNYADTIAGFNIWIQLDRPDILLFQTDTMTVYDTLYYICNQYSGPDCIDSTRTFDPDSADFYYENIYLDTIGNVDTAGTLCSGWDLVDARSLSGIGTDINIVGIADLPGGSVNQGIPAGQQGGVLVRILADVFNIDDTVTDRTVNMLIQSDFKDHFGFSTPGGTSLGWIPEEVMDTSCFICNQWVGSVCADWQEVTNGFFDCDSIDVVPDTILILDTANVKLYDGSLTVLNVSRCGNMTGNPDDTLPDISDLLYLVDYMFSTPAGPPPDPECLADMNCSGQVDISDLLYMVDYMFSNPAGPAPCKDCCSISEVTEFRRSIFKGFNQFVKLNGNLT